MGLVPGHDTGSRRGNGVATAYSFAVANAHPQLKALASWTAPTNSADGVARRSGRSWDFPQWIPDGSAIVFNDPELGTLAS
ncbi:MAG: HAD hydrolase family protein [Candidatus Nanopelagicales bacterium]